MPRQNPDPHPTTATDNPADGPEAAAADELLEEVYGELRRLAQEMMSCEKPGQTLQATALVHEAYLRLNRGDRRFNDRGHFFVVAAQAMRRILIDRARARKREKRGGGRPRIDLNAARLSIDAVPDDLLDLDDALTRLAAEEPIKAELVKLRFFAGMTNQRAADFLGISTTTADRYWTYARVWLYAEIRDGRGSEG